ncbi:MAG: hypothetical protein M3041_20305 [Acidobacteriota bacterium]|nr:hypothetical protein [Acidobacteriota bacterium]
MSKSSRVATILMVLIATLPGCKREEKSASEQPATFTFTVYPGSRYLAQLTELDKRADATMKPNVTPPPIAIYDSDAPLDAVANFYANSYGYTKVAADATNNLSAAKPAAYYRNGDLYMDVKGIEPLLKKLNVNTDFSKAQGKYRAVEIESKMNRPRVTIQRPYFDVINSQVVDRTMILMAP